MIDPEVIRRLDQQASLIRQLQGALGGNRIVRGVINGTGTAAIMEGTGFTLTDNGVGDYTITFSPPFSDRPSVTVLGTVNGLLHREHNSSPADGTAIRIETFTLAGANNDCVFHFIAIGPA